MSKRSSGTLRGQEPEARPQPEEPQAVGREIDGCRPWRLPGLPCDLAPVEPPPRAD